MNYLKYFLALGLLMIGLHSCNNNSTNNTPSSPTTHVVLIKDLAANPADAPTGHFAFFRFKDSTVVPLADSATTNWDIAFNGTSIIINCGTRGPGAGGAIVQKSVDFNSITQAPATGYVVESSTASAIPGDTWYSYDGTTHLISSIPGVVIIVRTADGKYAKMQILNYYKGAPTPIDPVNDISRYYEFKYVYQTDGSRNF
jgi:hypothetical protein